VAMVKCSVKECEFQKDMQCSLDAVEIDQDGLGDSDCRSFVSKREEGIKFEDINTRGV